MPSFSTQLLLWGRGRGSKPRILEPCCGYFSIFSSFLLSWLKNRSEPQNGKRRKWKSKINGQNVQIPGVNHQIDPGDIPKIEMFLRPCGQGSLRDF